MAHEYVYVKVCVKESTAAGKGGIKGGVTSKKQLAMSWVHKIRILYSLKCSNKLNRV